MKMNYNVEYIFMPYKGAAGMLIFRNERFTIGKLSNKLIKKFTIQT